MSNIYVSHKCYEFLVQVRIINLCTGVRHRFTTEVKDIVTYDNKSGIASM